LGGLFNLGYAALVAALGLTSSSMWWLAWWPSLVLGLATSALIAWGASRFFFESRRTGALELLMTTPLGARTLVAAQWSALRRSLAGPVLLMCIPYGLRLFVFLSSGARLPGGMWTHQLPAMFLSLINTVLGVGALVWLALWFGLRAQTQTVAVCWTVGLGKGIPYLLSLLAAITARLLVSGLGLSLSSAFLFQGLPLLSYAGMIWGARRLLSRELDPASGGGLHPATLLREAGAMVSRARHWTPPVG